MKRMVSILCFVHLVFYDIINSGHPTCHFLASSMQQPARDVSLFLCTPFIFPSSSVLLIFPPVHLELSRHRRDIFSLTEKKKGRGTISHFIGSDYRMQRRTSQAEKATEKEGRINGRMLALGCLVEIVISL